MAADLPVVGVASTEGLLLAQPGAGRATNRPSWVLYESNSVVLRRSPNEEDAHLAAIYHLNSVATALGSTERLPLLSRILVLPNGRAWLTDPFVHGELAGLDRRFHRAGITVLPTTIASLRPTTGSILLPEAPAGLDLPSGEVPIERMLFRSIPDMALDGSTQLRLARLAVRHLDTDLSEVLALIGATATLLSQKIELTEVAEIEHRLDEVSRRAA